MVLITGAGGMLGGYLKQEFQNQGFVTLGKSDENDFSIDLRTATPDFQGRTFDTVIHCAGTEEEREAMRLNLEGTKRLIAALADCPPKNFVYVSSHKVYSRDAGEDITEETNTWASDEVGKSKALAEEFLKQWSEKNNVTLTIVRPARMFGTGVKGETLMLFNDALQGKYIHVRGNDAKVSIVCSLDVARGIKKIYGHGGLFNVSDCKPVKFIDMVEALTANAGGKKRMTHLPIKWAEWIWRLGRWIPSIERHLAPEVVENRMKSRVINGTRFAEKSGIIYHDTIAVIEHRDKNYPYTELEPKKITAIHEV